MEKILVINNDIDTMTLIKKWLEKKSYSVKFTSNQDEAVDLVKSFKPALVLVDVLQKEVVEEIKTDRETASVPIILMTGYTLHQATLEVNVDDMIEKPFNPHLLEKKIEKLLSHIGVR